MALQVAAHGPISNSPAHSEASADRFLPGVLWAGFLTLLVAGPWLLPGYLFGTDWPGPRHFDIPVSLDSLAPLEAATAAIGWAIGGETTGKLMIVGSLYAASAVAYAAIPAGGFVPRAAAATLYSINPFVYGRLHYGQIYVLLAYAVLPWTLARLHQLLARPKRETSFGFAVAFFVLGMISPHLFLMAAVLTAILTATHIVADPQKAQYLRRVGRWVPIAIAITALASSYWIVPLLNGEGYGGSVIKTASAGQLSAYAAIPDNSLGLVPNLLGLYGFWAEATGRFTSMKAFVPFWPLILAVVLVFCAVGFAASVLGERRHLAPFVTGLLLTAATGLVLEMGVSAGATAGLVTWIDGHVVVYRGLRDAGKWGALLALVYSQLLGLGLAALLPWIRARLKTADAREWATGIATAVLLVMPLYYGNGLLFGAHGEIRPSQYPAGWYAADRMLLSDPNHGRALFLPWHDYMRYSFIKNQNSIVASPAPSFFSVPVLTSQDPEVPGIAPPATPDQEAVRGLIAEGSNGDWAGTLATLGVRYVLVDKDLDWQTYRYLDSQRSLTKVADLASIVVYRDEVPASAHPLS
jgi:hypothetical protein